jgi:hypothetical protein
MLSELPFDVWETLSIEGRELYMHFRESANDLEHVYRESVEKQTTRAIFRHLLDMGWNRADIFAGFRDMGRIYGGHE